MKNPAVEWVGSSPTHHPAFKSAVSLGNDRFRLDFPVGRGISRSRDSKRRWSLDRVQHLASWGIKGQIME